MELQQLQIDVVESDTAHLDNDESLLQPDTCEYMKLVLTKTIATELPRPESHQISVLLPANTEQVGRYTACGVTLNYQLLNEFHQYIQAQCQSVEPLRKRACCLFYLFVCGYLALTSGLLIFVYTIDKWWSGYTSYIPFIRLLIAFAIGIVPIVCLGYVFTSRYSKLKKRTAAQYWYERIHDDVNTNTLGLTPEQTREWYFTATQLVVRFHKQRAVCRCGRAQSAPSNTNCSHCGTLYFSHAVH